MHHSPAGHGSKLMFDVAVQSILVLKGIAQALHNLIRILGMRCSHHEHLLQSGVFLLLRMQCTGIIYSINYIHEW